MLAAVMTSEEYCRYGHGRVDGWLAPEAALLVTELAKSQDFRGHVGEIGVWHGKLFILLALLRRTGEHGVAVDLFDQRGPTGNHLMFRNNLQSFNVTQDVTVKNVNSLSVTTQDLLDWAGQDGSGFRLFSIDGGRSAEIIESDLECASHALAPGGLVILDGYYNETWPGVAEATNRFLDTNPWMIPVGTGFGKMLFTNAMDQAGKYRALMSRLGTTRAWSVNEPVFHGHLHTVLRHRPEGRLQKSADSLRSSGRAVAKSLVKAARSSPIAASRRTTGRGQRDFPTLVVSERSGRPGTPVTISGSGFGANESVEVKYRTGRKDSGPVAVVITTATTTEDGSFSGSGHIPSAADAGAKGFHYLVAKGSSYGVRATTTFSLT